MYIYAYINKDLSHATLDIREQVQTPACYTMWKAATSYMLSSFKQRNKNEIQKSISLESWKPLCFII